jgi:hypothetical protein
LFKKINGLKTLESFVYGETNPKEPFFIKNIESVQGDERDTIIFGIGYGIYLDVSLVWWIISLFFYLIVYSMIGNNIALHRYFTHNHFTVSKPIEYLFLWTGSMIGLGEPVSYAMTHAVHHRYSDVDGVDPHGPVNGKKSIFIWFQRKVDPNVTPRDRTTGSPNGTWQWFGWNANVGVTQAIGKGNPYGIDAIRFGRCDLVSTLGDLANGYATFLGAADWDNTMTRRLGLLIPQNGAYYWQGLLSLGTSGTAVDFRDANRAIFIANTEKVSSNFNKFEVRNASSRVDWTSISITALGTVARGNFEVVNNADVNILQCVFTDMGTFAFLSASTIDASTFRRCDQVTAGGAAFSDTLFDSSRATSAVSATTLNIFDNCSFVSDGTGHAVNLGTVAATTSMNWNCSDSGYAATNGSTGNETILVNVAASQTLTINVGAGYTIPTYYNTGAGTVSVVSGQVTTTLTVVITGTVTPIEDARVYLVATGGGPLSDGTVIFNDLTDVNGEVSDIRSLAADQQVTGWVRKSTGSPYYKTSPISATIDNATGLSLTIQMIPDE